MKRNWSTFFGILRWGLVGDILLFAIATLLIAVFTISSYSKAYLIALILLCIALFSFSFYKKSRKKHKVE